ncbi:hypothetical protein S245_040932, partial [Arachis hypogaea]
PSPPCRRCSASHSLAVVAHSLLSPQLLVVTAQPAAPRRRRSARSSSPSPLSPQLQPAIHLLVAAAVSLAIAIACEPVTGAPSLCLFVSVT